MHTHRSSIAASRRRHGNVRMRVAAGIVALALAATGCGGDDPGTTAPTGLTGEARCAANRDAGEITYLTGFGYFPALAIAVVLAAEDQGFFDEMCLDVTIQPSGPAEMMSLISANVIQFSANQISELAQAKEQGAAATLVLNWGHTPVHVLLVPESSDIMEPADFAGTTIGSVGGTLNAGLQGLLLNGGGLRAGDDYQIANRGFDPFTITDFDGGIAAFRSNEPDTLAKGGVPVRIFRPEDYGSVGTFAGIQVSDEFAAAHPTAAEDWVRAVVRATEWAIENPEATVRIAERLTEGDFDFDHELFRFTEEARLALASTPDGLPFGKIHLPTVTAELEAMVEFGILESMPDPETLVDNSFVDAVYGDGETIDWPGPIDR